MKFSRCLFLIILIAFTQTVSAQHKNQAADGRKVVYKYTYPGDDQYHYGVMNNEWYTRNIKTGKTFNISRDQKYNSTIIKLDALYPDARYKYKPIYSAGGGIDFIYTYPGDKQYIYGVKGGEWYTKNKSNNKIFNITRNAKFLKTIIKLDEMYPGAR